MVNSSTQVSLLLKSSVVGIVVAHVVDAKTKTAKRKWENFCSPVGANAMERKTQEQWLAEFKSIHGEAYDYSKSVIRRWCDKIIIICKNCGESFYKPLTSTAKGRDALIAKVRECPCQKDIQKNNLSRM